MLEKLRAKKTAATISYVDDDPRVQREIDRREALRKRRDEVEIEIEAAPQGQARIDCEADLLLKGDDADDKPTRAQLLHKLAVVERAEQLQDEALANIRRIVAAELRDHLTPTRQEHLARMDAAIKELADAITDYEKFIDQAEESDIVLPQNRIAGKWASASFGNGDHRFVLRQLNEWRAEFAKTGFLNK